MKKVPECKDTEDKDNTEDEHPSKKLYRNSGEDLFQIYWFCVNSVLVTLIAFCVKIGETQKTGIFKDIWNFLQLNRVKIFDAEDFNAILAVIIVLGFVSLCLFFVMKRFKIATYIRTNEHGAATFGKVMLFPHNHDELPGWLVINYENALKRKEEREDPTKYKKVRFCFCIPRYLPVRIMHKDRPMWRRWLQSCACFFLCCTCTCTCSPAVQEEQGNPIELMDRSPQPISSV